MGVVVKQTAHGEKTFTSGGAYLRGVTREIVIKGFTRLWPPALPGDPYLFSVFSTMLSNTKCALTSIFSGPIGSTA